VLEYYRQLTRLLDLPVVLFQYHASTGYAYAPELLAEICVDDKVVAVKNGGSSGSYFEDLRAVGSKALMIADSNSYDVVGMLSAGAPILLNGLTTIDTRSWVDLHDAAVRGDHTKAVHIANRRLAPLFDTFGPAAQRRGTFVARVKEALRQQGIIDNVAVRAPERSAQEEDLEAVSRVLAELGLLPAGA
jgi:dihydrodipicolinate synthase/N-acetylneuraminate lyase